ncbi:hypothetical protein Bca4012_003880 [Brassica carinata]
MVWCNHCAKNVPGVRPYDGALACDLCGRILENFNFSTQVTFVKNAAGQSQASGNVVRSVQSGVSSSRERRLRLARDELMNLKDALGMGDERDDLVDMAATFFKVALDQNFTKGRRTELVQCSCLYLTCRQKNHLFLLIDFSSYLRVSVYELGAVYLQLCEMLYIAENKNYEKLVDPSIYIPRFANARNIIASMKRDWIQTGRKPSGICGAALYTAALAHGIKCSKTDIVGIVHICEATLTKRLNEFVDTEAGSLNVKELKKREKEMQKRPFATNQTSNKETVHCKHQDRKPVNYGLCEECYRDFISVSGGLVGGSDPPTFQRAEKERMEKEKAAREENEGGISSLNHDEQLNSMREPLYSNRRVKEKKMRDDSEVSDESGNFSDVSDTEVDCYINNEEERRYKKVVWEEMNKEYIKEQAALICQNMQESLLRLLKLLKSNKNELRKKRTHLPQPQPRNLFVECLIESQLRNQPRFQEEGYVESYDINTDLPDGEKLYEEEDEEEEEDEHSSKSGVSYGSQCEPSSLRKKGLVVLPGEDALPPDVASKLFDPLLRASAANGNTTEKKGEAVKLL